MAEFNGTSVADTLPGTGADASGDDVFNPGAGNDVVNAGAGDDTINYSSGADTLNGGSGTDTVVVDGEIAVALEFDAFAPGAVGVELVDGTATDLNGVEKIKFTNGTVDLTAGTVQYFGTDAALTGGTTADQAVNGGIVAVDLSQGVVTDIINAAAFNKITHINGKAVDFSAADSVTTLASGATLTIQTGGAGTDDVEIDYARSNTFTHEDDVDTFTVTLSSAGGATITRDVTVTTAKVAITTGDNTIVGGSDADAINVSAGNDTVDGKAGNDTIDGGFGNDSLTGGAGDDVLNGGDGTDRAVYSGSVVAGTTNKSVVTVAKTGSTSEGTDTISSIEGILARNLGTAFTTLNDVDTDGAVVTNADALTAGVLNLAANSDVFGGATSLEISGGESASASLGSQLLQWTAGTTNKVEAITSLTGYTIKGVTIAGSATDKTVANGDTFTIAGSGTLKINEIDLTKGSNITYTAPTSDVGAAAETKEVIITVQKTGSTDDFHIVVDLSLSGNDDTLTVTDVAGGTLSGGIGADKLTGAAGSDSLDGGDGNDTLSGKAGDDKLTGEDNNDTLNGDEGDDQLLGGDGDDTLNGGDGNDFGNGGDGADSILGGKGDDAFFAGSDDNGNDTLKGEDGNDTLGGGEGDDNIDGGAGENLIFGGEDSDTIVISSGDDSVQGAGAAWAGDDKDTVTGGVGNDTIGGGEGDDSIVAGKGDDVIYGGATGDEVVDAGEGNDTIFASADRDTVDGGKGDDLIFGGGDKDSLTGGDGADEIWGGEGNDTVDAGAGNDTIAGGTGNDNLTGGAGADTFIFEVGTGADTVVDFDVTKDDVLDLSAFAGLSTDILDIATETTQGGDTGVLLHLGNNDSIFLKDVDLGEVREASILFAS